MDVAKVTALATKGELGHQAIDRPEIRRAAEEFEAMFLGEMLRMAGVGKMPAYFGGGAGEAAFSDFLTREYANEIARTRSIGVADRIYQHLLERAK